MKFAKTFVLSTTMALPAGAVHGCGDGEVRRDEPESVAITGPRTLETLEEEAPRRLAALTLRGSFLAHREVRIEGLVEVEGDVMLELTRNIDRVSFPDLEHVGGTLAIKGNADLKEVWLPKLSVARAVVIADNQALKSISLRSLTESGATLLMNENRSLERIDAARLVNVSSLMVKRNAVLQRLELAALANLDTLDINDNPTLREVELPALDRIALSGDVSHNILMESIELPVLQEIDFFYIGHNERLQDLAFPQLKSAQTLSFLLGSRQKELVLSRLTDVIALKLHDTSLERVVAPALERLSFLSLPSTLERLWMPRLVEGCSALNVARQSDFPDCAVESSVPSCSPEAMRIAEGCTCEDDGNLQRAVCPVR